MRKYEDGASDFSLYLKDVLNSILGESLNVRGTKIWAPWLPDVSVSPYYPYHKFVMRGLVHLGALEEIRLGHHERLRILISQTLPGEDLAPKRESGNLKVYRIINEEKILPLLQKPLTTDPMDWLISIARGEEVNRLGSPPNISVALKILMEVAKTEKEPTVLLRAAHKMIGLALRLTTKG